MRRAREAHAEGASGVIEGARVEEVRAVSRAIFERRRRARGALASARIASPCRVASGASRARCRASNHRAPVPARRPIARALRARGRWSTSPTAASKR